MIQDTAGPRSVKLTAGDAVIYPGTTLHQVLPVTRGYRLACFFWIEAWSATLSSDDCCSTSTTPSSSLRNEQGETPGRHRADRHLSQPAAHVGRHLEPCRLLKTLRLPFNRTVMVTVAVVAFHAVALWLLQTGLLRRAVELVICQRR